MNRLRATLDALRVALGRLTQREQLAVLIGGASVALMVLGGVGTWVGRGIAREQRKVQVKTEQLAQVLALQGEYKARQVERSERLRVLSRSRVRLVSWVEEAARADGVEIGQLRQEDGEASADGVIESRVDLRASGLSADRLQDFLNRLESGSGIVVVRRLKLARPYRKDTADVEMTVSTFQLKGA